MGKKPETKKSTRKGWNTGPTSKGKGWSLLSRVWIKARSIQSRGGLELVGASVIGRRFNQSTDLLCYGQGSNSPTRECPPGRARRGVLSRLIRARDTSRELDRVILRNTSRARTKSRSGGLGVAIDNHQQCSIAVTISVGVWESGSLETFFFSGSAHGCPGWSPWAGEAQSPCPSRGS